MQPCKELTTVYINVLLKNAIEKYFPCNFILKIFIQLEIYLYVKD